MTTAKTPAKLRSAAVSGAKRSLGVIAGEVAKHQAIWEAGGVPEGSFLTSALKYDQALSTIALLDALTSADEAWTAEANGIVEVRQEDLAALVLFAHEFIAPEGRAEGSPVARLTAAAFPDGQATETALAAMTTTPLPGDPE